MTNDEPTHELLEAERARSTAELHEALDALEVERARRESAEARLFAIESSRAWRWWSSVRRLVRRDRSGPAGTGTT